MRYHTIMGQCVSHIASQLKDIGFKNIQTFIKHPDHISVYTKPINGRIKVYNIKLWFDREISEDELNNLINDFSNESGSQPKRVW